MSNLSRLLIVHSCHFIVNLPGQDQSFSNILSELFPSNLGSRSCSIWVVPSQNFELFSHSTGRSCLPSPCLTGLGHYLLHPFFSLLKGVYLPCCSEEAHRRLLLSGWSSFNWKPKQKFSRNVKLDCVKSILAKLKGGVVCWRRCVYRFDRSDTLKWSSTLIGSFGNAIGWFCPGGCRRNISCSSAYIDCEVPVYGCL